MEPFRTLLVPALLFSISPGTIVFGMGRSMSPDLSQFRRPRRGLLLTLDAGPAVNLVPVAAVPGFRGLVRYNSPELVSPEPLNACVLGHAAVVNLLLAAIHSLLPIPPLDRGRVVSRCILETGFRRAPPSCPVSRPPCSGSPCCLQAGPPGPFPSGCAGGSEQRSAGRTPGRWSAICRGRPGTSRRP